MKRRPRKCDCSAACRCRLYGSDGHDNKDGINVPYQHIRIFLPDGYREFDALQLIDAPYAARHEQGRQYKKDQGQDGKNIISPPVEIHRHEPVKRKIAADGAAQEPDQGNKESPARGRVIAVYGHKGPECTVHHPEDDMPFISGKEVSHGQLLAQFILSWTIRQDLSMKSRIMGTKMRFWLLSQPYLGMQLRYLHIRKPLSD